VWALWLNQKPALHRHSLTKFIKRIIDILPINDEEKYMDPTFVGMFVED
jgi:hypothetical protein